MEHKGILSSAFNMSLGFVPVIISILLCELITQDTAILHRYRYRYRRYISFSPTKGGTTP